MIKYQDSRSVLIYVYFSKYLVTSINMKKSNSLIYEYFFLKILIFYIWIKMWNILTLEILRINNFQFLESKQLIFSQWIIFNAVLFFTQHSFSLWFRKFANLISVWMPFSLTLILSERLKAFLQIKQSLMVGRLHEMHVSERSKIIVFIPTPANTNLVAK